MSDDASNGKVSFTMKEMLEKIDGKLDKLDAKMDKKADNDRVVAMVEAVRTQLMAEVARVESLIAPLVPLVDPKTGVYSTLNQSQAKTDGKTIGAMGAIILLLAGILLKKPLGLG